MPEQTEKVFVRQPRSMVRAVGVAQRAPDCCYDPAAESRAAGSAAEITAAYRTNREVRRGLDANPYALILVRPASRRGVEGLVRWAGFIKQRPDRPPIGEYVPVFRSYVDCPLVQDGSRSSVGIDPHRTTLSPLPIGTVMPSGHHQGGSSTLAILLTRRSLACEGTPTTGARAVLVMLIGPYTDQHDAAVCVRHGRYGVHGSVFRRLVVDGEPLLDHKIKEGPNQSKVDL